MNAFPYLAVFTVLVSFAVLRASFDDLREAPLALGKVAPQERTLSPRKLRLPGAPGPTLASAQPQQAWQSGADEGLLDHELASNDPINAWLDRYLTPSAE